MSKYQYAESLSRDNLDHPRGTIRIVTLLPTIIPGEGQLSEVRLRIRLVNLDQLGPSDSYEALSYCWEPKNNPVTVYIDDEERPCLIGANLYIALAQLQTLPNSLPRNFWIDALSINQSDEEEKAHQISLMGRIYSSATRVIVWLGPAPLGDTQTMERIDLLADERLSSRRGASRSDHLAAAQRAGFVAETWLPGLIELMKKPYWSRAWIRQEVALARDIEVWCGPRGIPWVIFNGSILQLSIPAFNVMREGNPLTMADWLLAQFHFAALQVNNLITLRDDYQKNVEEKTKEPDQERAAGGQGVGLSLKHAIQQCIIRDHAECSEPRDRILSILGLVADMETVNSLIEEITSSLSLSQVYVKTAKAMIKTCWSEPENVLRILTYPRKGRDTRRGLKLDTKAEQTQEAERTEPLPSWAPDWGDAFTYNLCDNFDRDFFHANGHLSPASFNLSPCDVFLPGNILRVPVLEFDQIVDVATGIEEFMEEIDHQARATGKYVEETVDFLKRIGEKSLEDMGPAQAQRIRQGKLSVLPFHDSQPPYFITTIPHVLVAGQAADCLADPGWYGVMPEEELDLDHTHSSEIEEAMFLTLIHPSGEAPERFTRGQELASPERWMLYVRSYLTRIVHVGRGRRPALTRGGGMGMVPVDARVGDKVVILFGAPAPFVVRNVGAVEGGEQRHVIVGECYIQGVMQGELVKGKKVVPTMMEFE